MDIGARVGAIRSRHGDTVNFFGYGVYVGLTLPPKDFEGGFYYDNNIHIPTILLDIDQFIYGCECWWASEDKANRMMQTSKHVEIVELKRWHE